MRVARTIPIMKIDAGGNASEFGPLIRALRGPYWMMREDDADRLRLLEAFGQLIGNTDRQAVAPHPMGGESFIFSIGTVKITPIPT